MHENILYIYMYIYICICIFVTLHWKLSFLNTRFLFLQYKNTKKESKYTKKNDITRFLRAGSSSAHMAGLNPAGLVGSRAQTSDPAGHKTHACLGCLLFKWIKFHLNSNNATKHACKAGKKRETAYLVCFFSPHCLRSSAVLSRLCSFRFVLLPFLFSPSPPFCFPFSQ